MRTRSTAKPAVSEAGTRLDNLPLPEPKSGYPLRVTVVYEDAETRQWAAQVHERVARIAGCQAIPTTWWRVSDLSAPGVLAGAVSTAIRADVIIVAVRATDGLPLPFYVWVRKWMLYRRQPNGALVALLPAADKRLARPSSAGDYFREIAREARLDFVLERHKPLLSPSPYSPDLHPQLLLN